MYIDTEKLGIYQLVKKKRGQRFGARRAESAFAALEKILTRASS